MNNHNKLSHQQKQQEQAQHASQQAHATQEFHSPEELLRFDAARTEVPASIANNLKKNSTDIKKPASGPWWKRLFGG